MADKFFFSDEYKFAKDTLGAGNFAEGANSLIPDLKNVMSDDGPERASSSGLDKLRSKVKRGWGKKAEAKNLLKMAGTAEGKNKRLAALKFLRHLYLLQRRGGHSVWISSVPDTYKKWPSDALSGLSGDALNDMLARDKDHLKGKEMRDLSFCTQEALCWANKTQAVCTSTTGVGKETAETLCRRWFGDEDTTDEDVTRMLKKLATGFKDIAAAVNGHKLVLTDLPTFRGTNKASRINAAVASAGEKVKVIYIEGAFFGGGGDPLTGKDNYTRILVHEMSHMVVRTKDHRYRHYKEEGVHKGLKPGKTNGFNSAKAIDNADSWAFFSADANGKLSKADLKYLIK